MPFPAAPRCRATITPVTSENSAHTASASDRATEPAATVVRFVGALGSALAASSSVDIRAHDTTQAEARVSSELHQKAAEPRGPVVMVGRRHPSPNVLLRSSGT